MGHRPSHHVALLCAGIGLCLSSAAANSADAVKIEISKSDCRRAAAYRPSADVEYKPGVDVNGRKVAPADLPGTPQIKLPDVISLDVKIDLSKYATIPSGLSPEASAGTVKFDLRSGKLTFNDQPLDDEAAYELQAECQRVLSGR